MAADPKDWLAMPAEPWGAIEQVRKIVHGQPLARYPDKHAPGSNAGEVVDASLAVLAEALEAAEAYVRSDVWIDGHPYHGPSIFPETETGGTVSERLRHALAACRQGATGKEQTDDR